MSELAHRTKEASLFYNPLEGVPYFDRFDRQPMHTFEVTDTAAGTLSLEYYPVANYVRLVMLAGEKRTHWVHSYRLNRHEGNFATEEAEQLQTFTKSWLEREGIAVQPLSQGYPEIMQAVEETKRAAPVKAAALQPGETYLYVRTTQQTGTSRQEMAVFRAAEVREEIGPTKRVVYAVRYDPKADIGLEGVAEIDPHTFEPCQPIHFTSSEQPECLTLVEANPRPDTGVEAHHDFYPFSKGNTTIVNVFHRPEFDPLVLTGWTREKISFASSLQILQWQRHKTITQQQKNSELVAELTERHTAVLAAGGFDIVLLEDMECAKRDQAHAEKEAKQAYRTSLESLIDRFGEPFFAGQAMQLMMNHLHWLRPPADNHALTAPICVARPLEPHFLQIAEVLLRLPHPLPVTMQEKNASYTEVQALFGDALFWEITRDTYPSIFAALADGYKDLEEAVDPVGIMRDYFPKAYEIICQKRPDFAANGPSAIRS